MIHIFASLSTYGTNKIIIIVLSSLDSLLCIFCHFKSNPINMYRNMHRITRLWVILRLTLNTLKISDQMTGSMSYKKLTLFLNEASQLCVTHGIKHMWKFGSIRWRVIWVKQSKYLSTKTVDQYDTGQSVLRVPFQKACREELILCLLRCHWE